MHFFDSSVYLVEGFQFGSNMFQALASEQIISLSRSVFVRKELRIIWKKKMELLISCLSYLSVAGSNANIYSENCPIGEGSEVI